MKNLKRFTAVILMLAMMMSMTSVFASAADDVVTLEFDGNYDYAQAYQVLEIVNRERAAEGLAALTMDMDLMEAAMQRAAETAIYFSHTRPNGETCFTAFPERFEFGGRGENIAAGYENASDVMVGWMNSEGHRENIMRSSNTSIGIGCFYQDGAMYWVQLFSTLTANTGSQPANKVDTATVETLTENLDIYYDFIYDDVDVYFQLFNMNVEYSYEYTLIALNPENISYRSSDSSVLDITSSGRINSISAGTVTLYCYIDNILACEIPLEFEDDYYILGDANGDGEISNSDLIAMARYIVGIPTDIDLIAADVDENGDVTNADIIAVARYLVGLE